MLAYVVPTNKQTTPEDLFIDINNRVASSSFLEIFLEQLGSSDPISTDKILQTIEWPYDKIMEVLVA